MPLIDQLERFVEIHNCNSRLGVLSLRNPVSVAHRIPIGPILGDYFARIEIPGRGFLETWGALHITLHSLEWIETALSGWRWIVNKKGEKIDNPNWSPEWIIIAFRSGDAIFVDCSSAEGAVYGSIQQRNMLISNSLGAFFSVMAECMRIEHEDYKNEVKDEDDFTYFDSYLSDVKTAANSILGEIEANSFMRFFFE